MTIGVYRVDAATGARTELAASRTVVASEFLMPSTMAYPACRCPVCRPELHTIGDDQGGDP